MAAGWMATTTAAALATLGGCGHFGFDDYDPEDAEPPPSGDAALPALVCGLSHTPIATAAPSTDLAVAETTTGLVALWTSTIGGPLHAATFDDKSRVARGPLVLDAGPFTGVAGLAELTGQLSAVTIDGARQKVWALASDLGSLTLRREELVVASRDPIATGGGVHALMRSTGPQILMSYVRPDGSLGTDAVFEATSKVVALSADDGPGHGHLAWAEDTGICRVSDVDFTNPLMPAMAGGGEVISSDCYEPRNSNGPTALDSIFIAWRTSDRQILTRHSVTAAIVDAGISISGRAPRARFDGGGRFWVAWIDEKVGGDELHLATVDLAGAVVTSSLGAWTPAGDESFELVRRRDTTYLVVVGAGALDILTLCP